MRLAHRHFYPLVSHEFLHGFQVRVVHSEVGAETMTQIVEVEVPDAGLFQCGLERRPPGLVWRAKAIVQEYNILRRWFSFVIGGSQFSFQFRMQRNGTGLAILGVATQDCDGHIKQVDLRPLGLAQFLCANSSTGCSQRSFAKTPYIR